MEMVAESRLKINPMMLSTDEWNDLLHILNTKHGGKMNEELDFEGFIKGSLHVGKVQRRIDREAFLDSLDGVARRGYMVVRKAVALTGLKLKNISDLLEDQQSALGDICDFIADMRRSFAQYNDKFGKYRERNNLRLERMY